MKKGMRIAALMLSAVTAATSTGILNNPLPVKAAVSQNEATKTATSSGVIYADSRTDFRDESIYFLITTRFYDGDPSNNEHCSEDTKAGNPDSDPAWRGDFKGLIDKLDYIKALGFTAVWITPVVENDSGYDYHGYHAYNFSAVDTRYESNGITYQDLIDACHAKGIKVIQDVVLNHTCNWGEENLLQLTSDVYTERNQVVMNGTGDPNNIYHHNGFAGGGDYDTYQAQIKTIADDCFDLETENPTVYNYLVDCYTDYIDMGVDAFRVDTVKHLSRLTLNSVFLPAFKEAGGDDFYMFGEVCTKGHNVWYRDAPPISTCFYTWADDESWTSRWSNDLASNEALVEEHYNEHMDMNAQPTSDNAFLNGNEYHTPDYSERSGLDVIDFQMHWSFNDANSAFNTALSEDQYFNDSTWNVVYVDSHDYAPDQCQTVRYNRGTEAWAENLSLMFTFRGIPCIYYGSEIEFQAGKPIDVGPNAALSTTGRAYYGDNIEGDVVTGDFGESFGATGTMEETLNYPLARHIQRLNKIRQAVPALRKGQYSTADISGNNMAYKRRYTDSTTDSFALITVSGTATFNNIPNGTYVDCVTGDTKTVTNGSLTAECSGQGNLRVYVLNTAKTPAPGKIGEDGKFLYTSSPVESTNEQYIYFKNEAGWSSVTANLFSNGSLVESIPMSHVSGQDYACAYTGSASNLQVIFTDGSSTSTTADFQNGGYYSKSGYLKQYQIGEDVIQVSSVELSVENLDLAMGETATIESTVLPENAKNRTLTWTSSNTNVATVSNKGVVTPQGAGTAKITATSNNGISDQVTVTVTVPPYDYEAVPEGKTAIYFEKPSGWGSNINCYLYYGGSTTIAGAWPGSAMEKLPNGVYRYVFDTPTNAGTIKVLFNDGSNQAPSDVGFDVTAYGKYNSSGLSEVIEPVDGPIAVTGVSLNQTTATLTEKGETVTLTATVKPTNAANKNVSWTSSDSSVATVDDNGIVTAVANGTSTITVTTEDGSKTATCKVTVNISSSDVAVTGVTLNKSSATLTSAGATTTLTATVAPSNATNKNVTWSSSNTSVATVNSNGVVTAVANGTATITVKTADGGKTATCTVTVNISSSTVSVIGVTLDKSSAKLTSAGETVTLTPTVLPDNATNKNVTWSSSNTSVATVDSNGVVTAVANGTTTITVKTADGGMTATCKVTVDIAAVPDLTIDSFTASVPSPQKNYTRITLTANATGGSGELQYRFYRVKDGKTTVFRDYETSSSAACNPWSAGTYTLYVDVKDEAGNIATEQMDYTWTDETINELEVESFTASVPSPQVKNTKIILTANAAGGSGELQYRFYRVKDGKTTVFRDYSTSNSAACNPWSVGTYTLCVDVKDAAGNVITEEMDYTWTNEESSDKLQIESFTADKVSPQIKQTKITLTVNAAGGSGELQYRFYRVKDGKTTVFRDYSTSNSAACNPWSVGTYTLCVDVKDAAGNVVTEEMDYTWTNEKSSDKLQIESFTADKVSPQIKQTKITLTVNAAGGSGELQYRFYRVKDGKTTVFRDYSTSNSAVCNPWSAGNYTIYVNVKDEAGNLATTSMSYTWE